MTDHVRCVWLEKLYMDQLHITTAVSPDRVNRCNLLRYRVIPAAVIHFTPFLFLIPLGVILALLSPSQLYSFDPGSYSGLPFPIPTTAPALIFVARRIPHFLPSSIRVDVYLPTLLGDFSS